MPPLALLLFQIAVILVVARAAGRALRLAGQPAVVGEMLAGIALGPSVLGAVAPDTWSRLFAPSVLAPLSTLSQLGLVLFMFLVGLELDTAHFRQHGRAALVIAWMSIVIPFAMGAALAVPLHPIVAPEGVAVLPFALFVGAAMSVTAFPVLVRILEERALVSTPLGAIAIGCAAIDDVTAWILLAVVVGIARVGAVGHLSPSAMAIGAAIYVALMLTVGARLLRGMGNRVGPEGRLSRADLTAILFVMLVSAGVTEALGIHALFGAFLAGAVMPRDARLERAVRSRMEDLLTSLLLPLVFAVTGLRTELRVLTGDTTLLVALGAVLVVGVAGKLGGTALAARWTGMPWRTSLALGSLMNTRGLMALVILNVGLDIGVISPALFSIMVLMAIVTTMMTTPLLVRLVHRGTALHPMQTSGAAARGGA